jgi:hypothetical protein
VVQVGCELQRDWGRQETAEGFHADPVRRGPATGRDSQRARRQWSWCGPLRRAPRSAASPSEVGWRRSVGGPAEAVGLGSGRW